MPDSKAIRDIFDVRQKLKWRIPANISDTIYSSLINRFSGGNSYGVVPFEYNVPKNMGSMDVGSLAGSIHNTQIQDITNRLSSKGGRLYKKTPFLWSNVNIPLLNQVPKEKWLKNHTELLSPLYGRSSAKQVLKDLDKGWFQSAGLGASSKVPNIKLVHPDAIGGLQMAAQKMPAKNLPKKILFRKGNPFLAMGSGYFPLEKKVVLGSTSPPKVIHEMGHAADLGGSKLRSGLSFGSTALKSGLQWFVPGALIAGDEIKKRIPGTIDDKIISGLQKYGPEAYLAAASGALLKPEFKATKFSTDLISKSFPKSMAKPFNRASKMGFGRYLLAAGIPYALMSLARHRLNKQRKEEKKEIEKESSIKDIGKLLKSEIARRVLYPAKKMYYTGTNLGTVFGQFQKPTAESMKAFGTRIKPQAIRAAAYGAPALASGLLISQLGGTKEALEQSEDPAPRNSRLYKYLSGMPLNLVLTPMAAAYERAALMARYDAKQSLWEALLS